MDTPIASLIWLIGTGTLITQAAIAIGVVFYFLSFNAKSKSAIGKASIFLKNNSVGLGFLVAAVATVSSLLMSQVAHFIPCELCWYQRIFMFPQVVILGIALWKNNDQVRLMSLVLSVMGLIIALYHILLQYYPAIFPCSDEAANCALVQINYFGYITIPFMSATAFALIILLMAFGMRKSR